MPVGRILIIAAALAAAVALATPLATAAEGGPQELWRAYPLDPTTTGSQAPASPGAAGGQETPSAPRSAPTPSSGGGGDGGGSRALIAVGAGLALLALAGVAVLEARRYRRRRAPVPAAPSPPRPAPRPRRAATSHDALDLARLAAGYIDVVARGSRRPVVDLAANLSIDVEAARRGLTRARSRGLLIGAGRGRPGGTLSDEALRLLGASAAPVADADDPPQAGPGGVAPGGAQPPVGVDRRPGRR